MRKGTLVHYEQIVRLSWKGTSGQAWEEDAASVYTGIEPVRLQCEWPCPRPWFLGVRVADGPLHHLDGRQQRVQPARHDGLGGAAAAGDGDAAQRGVDGSEQQRGLDVVLPDHARQGEGLPEVALHHQHAGPHLASPWKLNVSIFEVP